MKIIPNVSNLVKKKTGYNTKISKIGKKITDHNHDKCITSAEFNTLAAETFAAKFAQANLASNEIPIENYIAALVKNTDFDDKQINLSKKVTSNKLKHLLVENKFKKLQPFDSSLFFVKATLIIEHKLYWIFQALYYTFKILGDAEKIVSWISKGLSTEKRTTPTTNDNSFFPSISWYANLNFCFVFKGSCLKQNNATYTPPRIFLLFLN